MAQQHVMQFGHHQHQQRLGCTGMPDNEVRINEQPRLLCALHSSRRDSARLHDIQQPQQTGQRIGTSREAVENLISNSGFIAHD